MEPITGWDGSLGAFIVGRDDDGRWLDGRCGRSGYFWDGDNRWVFLLRK